MKKNRTMRAASLMLVLTLITCCFVGGTFSKYITTTSSTDDARVAYWGFEEDAVVELDLFDDTYGTDVDSNDGENVIAPGTTKTVNFKILNTNATAPEVDYEIKVDVDESSCAQPIQDNENITWYLDGTEVGTWEDLLDAIKLLSGDASGVKKYEAGEIPEEFNATAEHTVGWNWEFSTDDSMDAEDTTMGATGSDEVVLTISVTATQVTD